MNYTFDEYMVAVVDRRDFVSDEDVEFTFTDEEINKNIPHFKECWKNNMSVYKSLTFLTLGHE